MLHFDRTDTKKMQDYMSFAEKILNYTGWFLTMMQNDTIRLAVPIDFWFAEILKCYVNLKGNTNKVFFLFQETALLISVKFCKDVAWENSY